MEAAAAERHFASLPLILAQMEVSFAENRHFLRNHLATGDSGGKITVFHASHASRDAMSRNGTIAAYEFEVSLAGYQVGCETLVDAVAIKAANDILTGEDPTPYSPEQLRPIVAVLLRYGFCRVAELLG